MAARPGTSLGHGGAGRGCRRAAEGADAGSRPLIGRPAPRALRASVFAVVCVLLSAGLHTLSAGDSVSLPVLVVAMAATWGTAFALGGRQRGRGTLLGACFVAQYGLHHLFSAQHGVHHLIATRHGLECLLAGDISGGLPDGGLAMAGVNGRMLLIHVAVALASSWWLERGESALVGLMHLAMTSVRGLLPPLLAPLAAPVAAGPSLVTASVSPARPSPPHVAAISRRGPPLAFSAH
jgi:hypothetical protein